MRYTSFWFLFLFISCAKIPLSKEYREINPYKEKTVLVFKSNKRDKNDTLFINKVITTYRDAPYPILKNQQGMHVMACIPNYYKSNYSLPNKDILLMEMNGGVIFNISINEHANFFAQFENLDFLKNPILDTVAIGNTIYADVTTLYSTSNYLMQRRNEIYKAYWSVTKGYIRFENTDGETYDLVSIYMDETYNCK